jgi:hypothetical protein
MNLFAKRAARKAKEHLQSDKTGLSLLKYSCKWFLSRAVHRIALREAPQPEQLAALPPDQVSVAVKVTGGIGDYVVIARVLRDLAHLSDALRFHVFCSAVSEGKWVFQSVPAVEGVFDSVFFPDVRLQYDCAMFLNQFAYFEEEHVNLGKVARHAPLFAQALAHCRKSRAQWDVFISRHPTMDGAFAHTAASLGMNRYTFIHAMLGIAPGPLSLALPTDDTIARDMAERFPRWITVNTGFDSHFVMSTSRATKSYPPAHWEWFVREFKQRFPETAVIQIGAKTSTPVRSVDENLVGRTSLAQATGVMQRALFHVDGEGGLVHIGASLGVKSIVLFGPTPANFFGYPDNVNLSSGTCGGCWWATERWMEQCPRGHPSPPCLQDLDPRRVLEAAVEEVGRQAGSFGAGLGAASTSERPARAV